MSQHIKHYSIHVQYEGIQIHLVCLLHSNVCYLFIYIHMEVTHDNQGCHWVEGEEHVMSATFHVVAFC